jgi:plastocyanin
MKPPLNPSPLKEGPFRLWVVACVLFAAVTVCQIGASVPRTFADPPSPQPGEGALPSQSPIKDSSPKTYEVHIYREALKFVPALLQIHPGDTVKWMNEGEKVHVLASIPGSGTNDKEMFSPMLKPGETWGHTFEKAGDYPYFCFIHSQMLGAIEVVAPGPSSPPPDGGKGP